MPQYLMVPYPERFRASNLGAKWDAKVKKWYIPDELLANGDMARLSDLNRMYSFEYLAVPFASKDHVKALGAKWDSPNKKWYTLKSNPNYSKLEEYLENTEQIEEIINEDFDNELPYTSISELNLLQEHMDYKDYLRLDEHIRTRSEGECQLCLDTNIDKADLFLCEVYEYTPEEERKKLTRLFSACKDCRNLYKYCIKNKNPEYLMKISDMSFDEATEYIQKQVDRKLELDQIKWNLDLSIITENGLKLK